MWLILEGRCRRQLGGRKSRRHSRRQSQTQGSRNGHEKRPNHAAKNRNCHVVKYLITKHTPYYSTFSVSSFIWLHIVCFSSWIGNTILSLIFLKGYAVIITNTTRFMHDCQLWLLGSFLFPFRSSKSKCVFVVCFVRHFC